MGYPRATSKPFSDGTVAENSEIAAPQDDWRDTRHLLLDTSNSYAGVDFQITSYVPVDQDDVDRLNRKFLSAIDGAERAGSHTMAAEYRRKLAGLQQYAYIEDMFEVTDLAISSRRSIPEVRRLGETSPTAHAKGPRTFAGTIVVALLKKDPFLELYSNDLADMTDPADYFVDNIPPFHLIATAHNEYGHSVCAAVLGVVLADFQTVLSVNDMYTELSYTFKAKHMTPFVHHGVRKKLKSLLTQEVRQFSDNTGESVSSLRPKDIAAPQKTWQP